LGILPQVDRSSLTRACPNSGALGSCRAPQGSPPGGTGLCPPHSPRALSPLGLSVTRSARALGHRGPPVGWSLASSRARRIRHFTLARAQSGL